MFDGCDIYYMSQYFQVFETVVQDSVGWNVSQAFGVEDLSISGMFQ